MSEQFKAVKMPMSLRDRVALKALPTVAAHKLDKYAFSAQSIAKMAFEIADAFVQEAEKKAKL